MTNHCGEPAYWDAVFAEPDPWDYGSAYEQKKYAQALSLIPEQSLLQVAELACAEGHFTTMLASRAGRLLASDISPVALERARRRCRGSSNITYTVLDILTDELPAGMDLIVCSEVLYYFPEHSLPRIVEKLSRALCDGGHLLSAHTNVLADDPDSSGFDWDHPFGARKIGEAFGRSPELALVKQIDTPLYSIRLYRRLRPHERNTAPAEIIRLPLEAVLSPAVEKSVVWGGAVMTRAEARRREISTAVPILAYHSVADTGPAGGLSLYRVSVDSFREQIRYLRRNGYHSITLEEWAQCIRDRRPIAGLPVIISFDDGYRDFLEKAWPILERADFTATVFVVSDYVGRTAEWDRAVNAEPLPLMGWEDLRMLQERGVEIQSHTASHKDLLTLPAQAIEFEGSKAIDELRSRLGTEATAIAYPFGRANETVVAALSACGYRVGLNTTGQVSTLEDQLMDLPRIQIDAVDNLSSFARRISSGGVNRSDGTARPVSRGRGSLYLAARLDQLIGEFVALQTELLEAAASESELQKAFRELFSRPVIGAASDALKPYQEISSGILVGFEESAKVQWHVENKKDHSISPESFLNIVSLNYQAPSRWLTIEIPLGWKEVCAAQEFLLSVYAEPSRPLGCWAVIRLPHSCGGYADHEFARLDLHVGGRHANRAGRLALPDLVETDLSRHPRLLLFFDAAADFTLRISYLNCYFC
jgi:peptidoglycan/xylan/chitin deacetylase (PgdA/CDA1 family)/SAM-dependent methyltransferase